MRLAMLAFGSVALIAGCATVERPIESASPRIAPSQYASDRLVIHSFNSAILSRQVDYAVVLPASYQSSDSRTYPVVYWLHGSGGYPPGILEMLANRFRGAMDEGRIPEALVVFPKGFERTNWMNAKSGAVPVEDFFVEEFVPQIDRLYRTIPDRSGRVLEGASMGGYGATRLALRHANLFSAASALNPGPMQEMLDPENAPIVGREAAMAVLSEIYGDDPAFFRANSPWQLAESYARDQALPLRIRMVLGENDPIFDTNMRFAKRLADLGIEHQVITVSDAGHNPRQMFASLGPDYWDFFRDALSH